MAKYMKLPVEIDAVQFTGEDGNNDEVTKFLGGYAGYNHEWKSNTNEGGFIKTLEGKMEFNPSDWIIRGVENEFYPCKDSIFKASYKQVTNG